MINIITGKVNSGKTSKLIDIFNMLGEGDGFSNRKIYVDDCYIGQEIVVMSSGESRVWSYRGIPPEKWQQAFCYEKYSFSKDGLEFAENIITNLLSSAIEPIYIDEIGPLELQEKGFHKLFKRCVLSRKEIYVVIRESCIKAVIEKYNIEGYKIIHSNFKSNTET
jgi:nucleoside-triphosphatase THEP1